MCSQGLCPRLIGSCAGNGSRAEVNVNNQTAGTKREVTDHVFTSYLDCAYKAFLLLQGRTGDKTDFERHAGDFDYRYQLAATASVEARFGEQEKLRRARLTDKALNGTHRLILSTRVITDGLATGPFVAIRSTRVQNFEPVYFHRYQPLSLREKLALGYKAVVLGKLTGVMPTHGQFIHGDAFQVTRLALSHYTKKAEALIRQLVKLLRNNQQPFLNRHCDLCEFRRTCRSKALEEDDMSLLQGISRGAVESHNRKGIFTVHQLSYTFRPRKTRKRARNPSKPRHFSLQAQAIRENKVFIHGTPEIPASTQSLYFPVAKNAGFRVGKALRGMLNAAKRRGGLEATGGAVQPCQRKHRKKERQL